MSKSKNIRKRYPKVVDQEILVFYKNNPHLTNAQIANSLGHLGVDKNKITKVLSKNGGKASAEWKQA